LSLHAGGYRHGHHPFAAADRGVLDLRGFPVSLAASEIETLVMVQTVLLRHFATVAQAKPDSFIRAILSTRSMASGSSGGTGTARIDAPAALLQALEDDPATVVLAFSVTGVQHRG
jgi:hypothetical protein